HKVTRYKKGEDSFFALGKRRYDCKQSDYSGQPKPVFRKKASFGGGCMWDAVTHGFDVWAKTTKKVVHRLECTVCEHEMQLASKRSTC
ncbi:hypothetical protein EDD15DRAFT_2176536, partial [Pisolithus albus]